MRILATIMLRADIETHLQTIFTGEYPALLQALSQPAPVSIHLNLNKVTQAIPLEPVPWSGSGYYLAQRPSFILDPYWHAGAYYVQEASSMFLEWLLKQLIKHHSFETVLDLCAAPGGKSILLSSVLSKSLVVSNEIIQQRVAILKENLVKHGSGNHVVCSSDAKHFGAMGTFFDLILTDVPCSGEGLFRKDPEAMKEWSPNHVDLCWQRQRRILADIMPSLKENGVLIYSTCTFNSKENNENVKWLCENFGLEVLNFEPDKNWNIHEEPIGEGKGFAFYPHKTKGEGFFICAMRRVSQAKAPGKLKHTKLNNVQRKELESTDAAFQASDHVSLFVHQGVLRSFPAAYKSVIELLLANVSVKHIGTDLGEIKHKSFIPSHALALQTEIRTNYPEVELDFHQAMEFLHKKPLRGIHPVKGWNQCTFQGQSIGWIKSINEQRMNNYFPEELRILKEVPEDFTYQTLF